MLGDSSYTYYSYDPVGRLSTIRSAKSDGSPLCYFEFDRDAAGDIISARRESGDVVYYGYDDLRRLTAETWNDAGGSTIYGFAWDYDPAGNRTVQSKDLGGTVTETYYTYDVANELTRLHELPADEWTYFGYDRNGSLVSRQEPAGTTYFAYADHGLVESIAPPTGDPVYFHYDGRLTRTAMTQGAETTYFTWDEDRLRMLELRTDGETRRLTHGHSPIDGIGTVVEEEVVGGERYYHHLDHRGTTYKITRGSDGAVAWSGQVNAWGEELAESGASPSIFWYQGEAWFGVEVGGKAYSSSTNRVYEPTLARFLQRDPINAETGLGGYSFATSAPLSHVDPEGLETWYELEPRVYTDNKTGRHYTYKRKYERQWRRDWLYIRKEKVQIGRPVQVYFSKATSKRKCRSLIREANKYADPMARLGMAAAVAGTEVVKSGERASRAAARTAEKLAAQLITEGVRMMLSSDELYALCKLGCIDAVGVDLSATGALIAGPGGNVGTAGLQLIANCRKAEVCLFGYAGGGVAAGWPPSLSLVGSASQLALKGTGKDLEERYSGGVVEAQLSVTGRAGAAVGGHASWFKSTKNPKVWGFSYGAHAGVSTPTGVSISGAVQGQLFEKIKCIPLPEAQGK